MTTTTNDAPYHTLQSLTDIFREATIVTHIDTSNGNDLRKAGVQAVLEALGYKLPVDPEREAFEKWDDAHPSQSNTEDLFAAWKAGREELRKMLQAFGHGRKLESENDGWIPWLGHRHPPSVPIYSVRLRDGREVNGPIPESWDWKHHTSLNQSDIIAYKIIPTTTTP